MFLSSVPKKIPHFILEPLYRVYERKLIDEIKEDKVPRHLGLIMDGNRRFAASRGLPNQAGHEIGMKKAEELLGWANEIGIKIVTIYAFSTENFDRDSEEVSYIMDMLEKKFREIKDSEVVKKNKIRINAIGNISMLPENVRQAIEEGESVTKDYSNMNLNICVAYGGRMEIVEAIKKILENIKEGGFSTDDIDVKLLRENLFTNGIPDPDIILRTGGEKRLSNFLLFQSAYSELFFLNVYFPLIRKVDFLRVIRDFQRRNRRFGR